MIERIYNNMLKITIGTLNPAKIAAVKSAFQLADIEFSSINVPSGVANQPFSDEETMEGAINRAVQAQKEENADIGIGLEGGVVEIQRELFLCNWGALCSGGQTFVAGGAKIPLPKEVADGVRAGKELGLVMAEYTSRIDVSKEEGAIGVFTNGQINRSEMFTHVLKLLIGQYAFANKHSK